MNTPLITVAELQKMLEEGAAITILDVRPQSQREEWFIAGSKYEDAYSALQVGDKSVFNNIRLPNTPVVTVCAAGKTSMVAADILNEQGYQAFSLEGGMKAWNYAWNTAELITEDIQIIQVRRVAKGVLSYIVAAGNEAAVIDAALDPQVYIDLAIQHNWKIKYVMDTHVHADYISRTRELAAATGASLYFSNNADVAYDFFPLGDSQTLHLGNIVIKGMLTPGHTPESISYLVDNKYLLSGDTLFVEGVGRPDLKADKEQAVQKAARLYESLQKIISLDDTVFVLPAHTSGTVAFDSVIIGGSITSLKEKIALLGLSKEDFIEQTISRIPPTPPNYVEIAALNKAGNHNGINPADLEAGANRCAVS